MSICKIVGANAHHLRWLFAAVLAASLGASGQVAHAQAQPEAGAQPTTEGTPAGEGDTGMTGEGTATEAAPPAETAPAAEEVPASYADWFRRMMDESHKPFEFHGYFRAGFGINGKGGDQEAFQAPGTPVKYRLGNETESYGELVFVNNWLNPERESDRAWFKTQLLLTFVTGQNQNFDADVFTIREAFAQAGNVIASQPGLKFWAGQRYYQRHDIHINDFFHFSESGYGGGIEDADMGFGKMAVAYFGNSVSNFDPAPPNTPNYGRPVENNIEVRFYDFQVPGGTGIAAIKGSFTRGENDIDATLENVPGFLVSLFHIRGGFMGGYNKASVQFGYGGSSDIESPLFYKAPTQALADSMQLLVTESAQINLADNITAMGAALVRWRDNGDDTSDLWLSAGFRPIYHFGKYTAIAAEAGVDVVQATPAVGDSTTGMLGKLTVAPLIRAGNSFWSRPEIRAFVTAAFWNENFQGAVGGAPYADDKFGLAFGVQAESWW